MKKAKMRGAAKEMNSKTGSEKTLFEPTGLPPWSMTISLALQHLVAMIVGCVTPAIMIANVARFKSVAYSVITCYGCGDNIITAFSNR